nr:hypothetical protein [Tanacetum cinerariifolium]
MVNRNSVEAEDNISACKDSLRSNLIKNEVDSQYADLIHNWVAYSWYTDHIRALVGAGAIRGVRNDANGPEFLLQWWWMFGACSISAGLKRGIRGSISVNYCCN